MGRMVDLWSYFFPLGTRNPRNSDREEASISDQLGSD